jgi:cellulose synthase/poly-beta-1,6-N-acetylglucosamine synthase-like glycosyltransferase
MSPGRLPGLAEQPLGPRTDHVVAGLPAVLVPQLDDEDAKLQQLLATLALRRAWGQISQRDFAVRRAIALGRAPPPRPTLRQRWDRLRAAPNEPRVVVTVQPQRGDNDEELQSILDELALQRAWGQISQRDFTAQRAVVFELLRHPYGAASSRVAAPSFGSPEHSVREKLEDRAPQPNLEVHLAELWRQRAFGQIGQQDFEARRAVLLRPRGMASVAALPADTAAPPAGAVAPAPLPRPEDRRPQPSLEVQLAELGRQRAFGQISWHDFTAQRAAVLRSSALAPSEPIRASAAALPRALVVPVPTRRLRWRALPSLALAASLAWLIWQQPEPWEVGLVVALTAALATKDLSWVERRTVALAVGVLVSAIGYFTWRIGVVNLSAWWIAVPLFAAEALGALNVLGLQYTFWPRREPAPPRQDQARDADNAHRGGRDPFSLPTFVLVPTVDEGVGILEPTISGVITAVGRYRSEHPEARVTIVVCNDGLVAGATTTGAVENLCKRLGVECLTRPLGGGAKAGNIEHARDALGIHGDALFAIFDADQVPEPDFFLRTIPPFADPSIGWVQTGQYYRNLEEPVARWANDQQALFYRLVLPGKATQNSVFICGTNVVIRADALDEIGGLPQDSVTEDFAASIRLHGRWRSVYLQEILATGLGPVDLGSYFRQQNRWARGTLKVLSEWRRIILRGSFTFEQRIQYALSCTYYLSGLRDLTYLLAPVTFLLLGTPAVAGATLDGFIRHFVPYFLVSQIAFWHRAAGRTTWRGIVIGFASFPTLVAALFSVVLGRLQGFVLTPKKRAASSIRPAVPHIVAVALILVAVPLGAWRYSDSRALISLMWLLYTLTMLLAFLTLALRDASRSVARFGNWLAGRFAPTLTRLRRRPVVLGALVPALAVAVALSQIYASSASPPPFDGQLNASRGPVLGVHAEGAELHQAQELLGHVDVIGQAIELGAGFPRAWAEQVKAEGATPWLTLTFTTQGRRTLESSLLSIANGVHDAELAGWARAARNYGQPILLTVLPAVDRNWSGTSAVIGTGIPEDVAPAWSRIRKLFADADNVAFVWAPADPLHDQAYAPPASEIDVVQATWFHYPTTPWPDPESTLRAIARRLPGKPILIDVSAAGPPADKAAWLSAVVRAAPRWDAMVVYHEGGPFATALAPGRRDWSLTALTPAELCSVLHAADRSSSVCTSDPAR